MKILISAGPTREKIDAVRFLSNRSTGKMGYALAEAALKLGHEVTLVSGPVALEPPAGAKVIRIESAAELAAAVHSCANDADIIIMAAAVADYRPKTFFAGKLKKQEGGLTLELERTEDVLLSLGMQKRSGQILVGFAAETDDLMENAISKLKKKNLDWIIANDVSRSDRGFASGQNEVTMIDAAGKTFLIPLADKKSVAEQIIARLIR
ncbi:MAG: bifunctional phosphopantothenoylcysteine decarboxylase/phosphopantothenate--cysteine ligase CoaBC [Victivallaceae bacterium]